jgi:6-phosphogluconolactonase
MNKFYIGTYTSRHSGEAQGIYSGHYDPSDGSVQNVRLAAETPNPSFLALHPSNRYLYAVTEIANEADRKLAGVSAYAVTGDTLTFLNKQETGGLSACHVSIDATARQALVANYGSGSVAVLPINDDGSLAEMSCHIQHEGSSVNAERQEGPHAHSINLDGENRFAIVCDLGTDRIYTYAFDADAGTLTPGEVPSVAANPGAGPRHFAMHQNRQFAYVINEMNGTMSAYHYDAPSGALREIATYPTLPDDYEGENSCADVQVSPCGRFLYGSNRVHDSIVAYGIDGTSGELTLLGWESTQGNTPRNFAIAPGGRHLLAANQDSHTIVSFRMDPDTGDLSPSGYQAEVPSPICIAFERDGS